MSNGMVRIHPLSTPYSLCALDSYWALSIHDNHYGAVSHLATSFDDQYVISGGDDGNVFVYQTNLPTIAQREKEKAQKVKVCMSNVSILLRHLSVCIIIYLWLNSTVD